MYRRVNSSKIEFTQACIFVKDYMYVKARPKAMAKAGSHGSAFAVHRPKRKFSEKTSRHKRLQRLALDAS